MADHLLQNIKQSFSLSDIEFLTNHPGRNSYFQGPIEFPNDDNIFPQLSQSPAGYLDNNFPGLFTIPDEILTSFTEPVILNETGRKRKATDNDIIMTTPENSSANTSAFSSPQGSHNGTRKTNRIGRGKKAKGNEKEDEKPRDVVHVRAKRGQATDSHSLAERDRRRKINERLQCLQDIVPGCYKTMGMAVMLDEIINYVQSLQSQVEFLSTRLSVASTFYDFNPDTYAMEIMQRAKAIEALNVQNIAIQEFQSAQFAPLGLNFGYGPN
ncbi:hypothetical protein CASFOL_034177 [Castilleja foliolosa]|uniref:BHLH domain-containing protein n=1 Tax=Castilleja foliolosa TaxID=1961234 RepID=A0ABD3BWU6_9LAMI